MRHETIPGRDGHSEVDLANLWPVGATAAPFPIAEAGAASERRHWAAAPRTANSPGTIGAMVACAYAALIGAMALASAGSA